MCVLVRIAARGAAGLNKVGRADTPQFCCVCGSTQGRGIRENDCEGLHEEHSCFFCSRLCAFTQYKFVEVTSVGWRERERKRKRVEFKDLGSVKTPTSNEEAGPHFGTSTERLLNHKKQGGINGDKSGGSSPTMHKRYESMCMVCHSVNQSAAGCSVLLVRMTALLAQVHRCTGAQVHRCTGAQAQVHRCTGTQVHKHRCTSIGALVNRCTITGAQVHRYTGAQCTGARVHRCTSTGAQLHRYTGAQVNRCTSTGALVQAALACSEQLQMLRVGHNHKYTVYISYIRQENYQIYSHIRCIYTVLAKPYKCSFPVIIVYHLSSGTLLAVNFPKLLKFFKPFLFILSF